MQLQVLDRSVLVHPQPIASTPLPAHPTSPRCSSLGILLTTTEDMAMAPPLLEIACFNYESAVNAALGGADRIEWVFPCCRLRIYQT